MVQQHETNQPENQPKSTESPLPDNVHGPTDTARDKGSHSNESTGKPDESTQGIGGDSIQVGNIENSTSTAIGQRAAAAHGGIAISGDVGGDVIITIGNREFKFPRLMQAAIAITTLGVIFLVVAQVITRPPPQQSTPSPMKGDFNVVVAEFGEINGNGDIDASPMGAGLAEEVFKLVSQVAQEFQSEGFKIEVRSPQETGRIPGSNEQENDEQIKEVATSHNADLVIYGNLIFRDGKSILLPKFYLSSKKLSQALELAEAPLLVDGTHDFGSEISVNDDIKNNAVASSNIRTLVSRRADAMAQFVIGLGYLALNRSDEAFRHFEKSIQTEGLQDSKSQAVVYLFLGTASALRNDLSAAQTYYTTATNLDDKYARAILGSAIIHFLEAAQNGCKPNGVDTNQLQLAVDGFKEAQEVYSPEHANIRMKSSLYLANAYICASQAQIANQWQDAYDLLQGNIIERYEEDQRAEIRPIASEAYASLGLWYWLTKEENSTEVTFNGIEAFQRAIELSRRDDRKAYFFLWIALIHLHEKQCQLADSALSEAAKLYEEIHSLNPQTRYVHYEQFRGTVDKEREDACSADL